MASVTTPSPKWKARSVSNSPVSIKYGKYAISYFKDVNFYVFQDAASPKFTILVQLAPCANQKFDTCLKAVKIMLNNDRNNVSAEKTAVINQCTIIKTTI